MNNKRFLTTIVFTAVIWALTACGHEHTWAEATCTTPKMCECGEVEGEALGHTWIEANCETAKACRTCNQTDGNALGHTWVDATCTTAKICNTCQKADGEPLGHTWKDADCETAKTCTVCNLTDGEPLEHNWMDATYTAPKTCSICNQTEGEPLPRQVIVKDDKGLVCTNEMLTAVKSALKAKGLDDNWVGNILIDYYNATNGNSTKVDETILNNLVDSLDNSIKTQEQINEEQRQQAIEDQQKQQNQNNNQGNTSNSDDFSPGADFETPENDNPTNDGPLPGEITIDITPGKGGDGGELITDITINSN